MINGIKIIIIMCWGDREKKWIMLECEDIRRFYRRGYI